MTAERNKFSMENRKTPKRSVIDTIIETIVLLSGHSRAGRKRAEQQIPEIEETWQNHLDTQKESNMTEDTLELWYTIRVPDTCQTHIDIDDSSGELVIEISGVGAAPTETAELINGIVVSGIVRYNAAVGNCQLKDVQVEPIV